MSPLLEHTKLQVESLQTDLQDQIKEFKLFISIRYWHPLAHEVILQIKEYFPSQVVLLPLYPQFSTTTTLSSVTQFKKLALEYKLPIKTICYYPINAGFINRYVELIKEHIKGFNNNIYYYFQHMVYLKK